MTKSRSAAGRFKGHATRWTLSAVTGSWFAAYGAALGVLAAYSRLRYGKQEQTIEVYPGLVTVLKVRDTRRERREAHGA